jgi:nicotinate-nucleotide adenylyltransferase
MSGRLRRLGMLGGTFDPIHLGHLVIASYAADALGLDAVLFLPAQSPPHKRDRSITPAAHRVSMVERAIADDDRFRLSRLDLGTETPSYTADLVERLAAADPDSELYFLAGADSLRDFGTWHEPERIIRTARLAIAPRPGIKIEERMLNAVPNLRNRVALFDAPLMDIASTDLRRRVRAGHSIRYVVPDAVLRYIEDNGLYLDEARRSG